MRARYYDPAIGRFISEDPIRFAGGDVNLFAYTANNPVNFVDPWGLAWQCGPKGCDNYALGRNGIPGFEPGKGAMRTLETYGPAFHDFAVYHDYSVHYLTGLGVPDIVANVPTMGPSYVAAVAANTYETVATAVGKISDSVLDRLSFGSGSDDQRYVGGDGGGGNGGSGGVSGGGK